MSHLWPPCTSRGLKMQWGKFHPVNLGDSPNGIAKITLTYYPYLMKNSTNKTGLLDGLPASLRDGYARDFRLADTAYNTGCVAANTAVGNQNKVTDKSNLKNNNKRTIRVQIKNIDSGCTIQVQVQNIDSNLNSSPASKKRVKNKSISVKNPKEWFGAFKNVIR